MNICYVWDEKLIWQCDRLPAVKKRASLVNNLITAYDLIKHLKVVRSSPASFSDLKEFHSELYLDHLKTLIDIGEDEEYMITAQDEEYGIGYDCPPVSNMYELVSTIAGGSITAAKCLVLGVADVVLNWCGGWHHAQRFSAYGFCYVNDIVLAIEKLRKKFSKVLYVDLDVHHGDGVQDAYNLSKSVFTLSIHKFEPGFYPGTGGVDDIGTLAGRGYSCNMPLNGAYSDDTLKFVFERVFEKVYSLFAPDAIVLQCGADALAHDMVGGAGLTINGYRCCVQRVLDKRKPTILLGGGGYNHSNAARLWASLTALVVGVDLNENIPEHESWTSYGPGYTLSIQPTLARDPNKKTYLDDCLTKIIENLEKHLKKLVVLDKLEVKRRKTEPVFQDEKNLERKENERIYSTNSPNNNNNTAKLQIPVLDKLEVQRRKIEPVLQDAKNLEGKENECIYNKNSPNNNTTTARESPATAICVENLKNKNEVDIYTFTDD